VSPESSLCRPGAVAGLVGALALVAAIGVSAQGLAGAERFWPQWRGPHLRGVSDETNLPERWSKTENIAWKLPMPGRSGSTPIVWGDQIFLNVSDGRTISLWCIDRVRGSVLWRQPLATGDRFERKHNMSSPSPVTDGRNVWVMTGTGMLKAFDVAGTLLWTRDFQKDYGTFGLKDVFHLASRFTVQQMLAREEFRKRQSAGTARSQATHKT